MEIKDLNLGEIFIVVLMTLVLFQGVGLLLDAWFDIPVKLGPVFILVAIVPTAALSFAIFKKMINGQVVDQKDIFAIVISALLAVVVLFFLRDFVPEIFLESRDSLMSMVGMG